MPAGDKSAKQNAKAGLAGKKAEKDELGAEPGVDVGAMVASTMKEGWADVWKASYADRKINKDVSFA